MKKINPVYNPWFLDQMAKERSHMKHNHVEERAAFFRASRSIDHSYSPNQYYPFSSIEEVSADPPGYAYPTATIMVSIGGLTFCVYAAGDYYTAFMKELDRRTIKYD